MSGPRPEPPRDSLGNTEGPAGPAGRHPNGIGPFTFRRLAGVLAVVLAAAVVLFVLTRPISVPGPTGPTLPPGATPYLVGDAREGLAPGDLAPELEWRDAAGATRQLLDLDGRPVRLADLRGKVVLLNFWATWCPPCQGETPVLREIANTYGPRGLVVIGVAVQETTPEDVRAYATTYNLPYRIAFDATADIFNRYRIFALPTQVLIGADGRVVGVLNGPLTPGGAATWIAPLLGPAQTASPG